MLISKIQIPCINLVKDIGNIIVIPVCKNNITDGFEFIKIPNDAAVEKTVLFHGRLINTDLSMPFALMRFITPCIGELTEVIAASFHRQAIYADDLRILCNDLIRNKILSRAVRRHNCRNNILRHMVIVGK